MFEIGRYLLKNFFDDDPSKVQDRSPNKAVSLRKLADHPDINIPLSGLSRAVDLAIHEKQMASVSTSKHLTAFHKIELCRIQDEKIRARYVRLTVDEKLSVRRLQDRLALDGIISPKGSRSLTHEQKQLVQLGLSQITSPLDVFQQATLDKFYNKISNSTDIPDEGVRVTLDKLKLAKEKIAEFIDQLEKLL